MSTMPTDFLFQTEIEANDPKWATIYKNMQGNILKGHGRDHAIMIFISFKENGIKAAKAVIVDFTHLYVTSFYKQLKEREHFKSSKIEGDTFGAVFISSKGYEALGEKPILKDLAFAKGMKARRDLLNDPTKNIEAWHNADIHAMLLLADDNKTRMNLKATDILNGLEGRATIVHIEYGDAIRNFNGDGLEHNGYVDGISQPLFLKDEVEEYVIRHGIQRGQGLPNDGFAFNPIKTPGLILLHDPYAPGVNNFGSYFVFRKLEQHVRAFKTQEAAIGDAIYEEDEDKERSGARLVGRFENGTPIQLQGDDRLQGGGSFNNFNYKDAPVDPSGGRCPHFAHIRKTNPRTDGVFDDHTMARRGIPFGYRDVSTEQPSINENQYPSKGVGLLFMSYQKSLVDQFEFIQGMANLNDNSAIIKDGGVDPIIGQGKRDKYLFPKDGDERHDARMSHSFDQHIHFKGGEYFFAPSTAYFENLKAEK
jgi:Dyp-type peroxidase family